MSNSEYFGKCERPKQLWVCDLGRGTDDPERSTDPERPRVMEPRVIELERTDDDLMHRAAEACEALELDDPLRAKMLELLGDVRSRITKTRADRGRRPPIQTNGST